MTDPIYEYVKGEGWIVNGVETLSWEQDGFCITIYARKPVEGELWYAEDEGTPLFISKGRLQGRAVADIGNTWDRLGFYGDLLNTHKGPWVTVRVELI